MTEKEKNLQKRRKQRAKQTAEIFTPPFLVNDMLNKLPDEVWQEEKTFIDPACGNGNFLIAVLWRKINKGHNPLKSLKTIYGVDIMRDNVRECRWKLLKIISLYEEITYEHIKTVMKNIVCPSKKTCPRGSLDYDFSFSNSPKKEDIEEWLEKIQKGELEMISLPVEEVFCEEDDNDIFDVHLKELKEEDKRE